jgi:hypothetical protein
VLDALPERADASSCCNDWKRLPRVVLEDELAAVEDDAVELVPDEPVKAAESCCCRVWKRLLSDVDDEVDVEAVDADPLEPSSLSIWERVDPIDPELVDAPDEV